MKKRKSIIFIAIISSLFFSSADIVKTDQHKRISPDRIYRFERQEVTVDDFDAQGYILDIGGGGEGVIGVLKSQQVIAIDISKRELEEAPAGPLKIVMDARDLKFIDDSFNTATIFFTFCYIDGADHEKVFEEILRVLSSGGRLLIWDVLFPKRVDEKKDIALVPLLIHLPVKNINTGYGIKWPEKGRGLAHYIQLAEKVGFTIAAQKETDKWFFLELKK